MKYDNQLRYAVNIVNSYDGTIPLSSWLKDFFRSHKQMGSTDRKTISEMVYGYYRLGFSSFASVEERLLAGIYIGNHLKDIIRYFDIPAPSIVPDQIFPYSTRLSNGIDASAFASSFLVQPDLFLRIRPGKKKRVTEKLERAGISFDLVNDHCIALPNSTKVELVLSINEEVVIQDKSSQETGKFLDFENVSVWDCCAASGGKAIMAYDRIKNIDLTVSDMRPTIIHNLKQRFDSARISGYHSFVADLTDDNDVLPDKQYDLIIGDLPCSGSGTWSRTPEQLYFFREEKIDYYRGLQEKIISRVLPYMKKGGYLLYITCSVFAAENEEMVDHIQNKHQLPLVSMELIRGYNQKADSMFAALFQSR